ncbi:MAG: chemotaxis protein CheW [Gemmatimonadales bacterium]
MAETLPAAAGLVVRVAGVRWFIPVAGVVEVMRDALIIRVPGAVAAVRGMVNHRGRIITVADPVRSLDLPGDTGGAGELVVVEVAGRRFALAVDGVVELNAEPRTGLATLDLIQVANAIFA